MDPPLIKEHHGGAPPASAKPHKPLCITGAGFSPAAKQLLQQQAEALGVKYSGDLVHNRTTHLVCRRVVDSVGTLKYVKALEWGLAIVSHRWLTASVQAGKLLPTAMFKSDVFEEGGLEEQPSTRVLQALDCNAQKQLHCYVQKKLSQGTGVVGSGADGSRQPASSSASSHHSSRSTSLTGAPTRAHLPPHHPTTAGDAGHSTRTSHQRLSSTLSAGTSECSFKRYAQQGRDGNGMPWTTPDDGTQQGAPGARRSRDVPHLHTVHLPTGTPSAPDFLGFHATPMHTAAKGSQGQATTPRLVQQCGTLPHGRPPVAHHRPGMDNGAWPALSAARNSASSTPLMALGAVAPSCALAVADQEQRLWPGVEACEQQQQRQPPLPACEQQAHTSSVPTLPAGAEEQEEGGYAIIIIPPSPNVEMEEEDEDVEKEEEGIVIPGACMNCGLGFGA